MFNKKLIIIFFLLLVSIFSTMVLAAPNTTINVIGWPLAATDEIKALLPEFEKETGISVKMELAPESTVHEKLAMEFAGNTGAYDVAMIGFAQYPEFARAEFITSLEPYISKEADNKWLDLKDFFPGYLASLKVGEELYGLPVFLWGGCLMYRKDLFDKYGIKVPQTMEELAIAAEKLTLDTDGDGKTDLYGISMRGAKGPFSTGSAAFAYSFGGDFLNKEMKPQLTESKFLKGVDLYVKLLKDYGAPGAAGHDWMEVQELFVKGKVAMIVEASDYAGRIEDPQISDIVGKVGYTTIPKALRAPGYMFTGGWAMVSSSRNKDAAWKFIQWSTSKATQMKTIASGKRTCATSQAVWESKEFGDLHPFLPVLKEALNEAHSEYFPHISEYTEVMLTYTGYVSEAIAGKITTKEAMEKANSEITEILTKAGYYK